MPHKVGNGAILGITSEDGVVSSKRIALMDRTNFKLVGNTVSDEFGAYSFSGLNPDTSDYLIFCVDDDGNPTKQPVIYDKVQPIYAHQGGFFWGNWFHKAMQKEPLVMFLSIPDGGALSSEKAFAYGVGASPAVFAGGYPSVRDFSVTPGAENIPSLDMLGVVMGRQALNHKNLMTGDSLTTVTCELVLNITADTQNTNILLYNSANTFTDTNSYTYTSTLLNVQYLPATKKINIIRSDMSSAPSNITEPGAGVTVISYSVPEELHNTTIHIVASIEYSNVCNLFINGALVATKSLEGTIAKVGTSSNQKYTQVIVSSSSYGGSYKINESVTTASIPIISLYSETTTGEEVLELYNALFTETLPNATGYKKAVVEDYPLYFYRLHEATSEVLMADALRPYNKVEGSGLKKLMSEGLAQSSQSPVVKSGNGSEFSGAVLYTKNSFIAPMSPYEITVDFVARPDVETVGTRQAILRHADKNGTPYFEVRLTPEKKFLLQWREGASEITVTFDFAADLDEIKHYAFTINKRAGQAILFVDGAEAEVLSVSSTPFKNLAGTVSTDNVFLFIGGTANTTDYSISYPYKGYLAEVAMYPSALSAGRIKVHFDERNTL